MQLSEMHGVRRVNRNKLTGTSFQSQSFDDLALRHVALNSNFPGLTFLSSWLMLFQQQMITVESTC